MTIDVNGLSAKELTSLIAKAEKLQTRLASRPKATAMRARIDKYVKDHGYTIAELYGLPANTSAAKAPSSKRAGRKLGKVAAKYRNPDNPQETWTGRGRQPRWMAALVAKGKAQKDFLIK